MSEWYLSNLLDMCQFWQKKWHDSERFAWYTRYTVEPLCTIIPMGMLRHFWITIVSIDRLRQLYRLHYQTYNLHRSYRNGYIGTTCNTFRAYKLRHVVLAVKQQCVVVACKWKTALVGPFVDIPKLQNKSVTHTFVPTWLHRSQRELVPI